MTKPKSWQITVSLDLQPNLYPAKYRKLGHSLERDEVQDVLGEWMVDDDGASLNQLFDTLAEWETHLQALNVEDIPDWNQGWGMEP